MGTWGAGNFESDDALDFVGDLIAQLTNIVESCLADEHAALDEGGEAELMPSVAIIKMLAENCNAAPPKPAVIEKWRDQYLEIYDTQIDDFDPDATYKVERRQTIETTFQELSERAQQFWS